MDVQDNPTISFVVPAYNEADYIGDTLKAILAEIEAAGCAAEVIVVDNASRDATREAALAFPGVIVVDEPVKGLVQARRAGYLAAKAPLVANIDADTIVPAGWLAKVLALFAVNPKLAAVSGPYSYYDVPFYMNALVGFFYRTAFISYFLSRHVLRVGSMMQGGNFVVTRAALDAIGGYNPAFTFYGEDTDLACRLSKVGEVKFTFALLARSSGRRLLGEGLFRTFWNYSVNYYWTTFFGRPFTRAWLDYRRGRRTVANGLDLPTGGGGQRPTETAAEPGVPS